MAAYEYASELKDIGDAAAPGYNNYPPHLASNITQAARANTYQNAPRIPGNTMSDEHRVKKVVKVWTCAKQHPTSALIGLRTDIKFEQTFSCQTNEGSAMIYTVVVDGVTYEGKGTKSGIAKGIAAHKALVGIKANGVQFLQEICDMKQEEETVTKRLVLYEQQLADKAAKAAERVKRKEENEMMRLNKSSKEYNEAKKTKTNAGPMTMDHSYEDVKTKYGPDVTAVYVETRGENKEIIHQCTLKVQGFTFLATSTTKKRAVAGAAKQAMETFTQDPPPHVNERKRKVPGPFVPKVPVDFPDMLAAKCWSFVETLTKDKHPAYVKRRNLVCIVKVDGLKNDIAKCTVVAVGSGTLVIDLPNMVPDGTVVNDCTGEALAVRAFRKYLLGQISKAGRSSSIFTKDRAGKLILTKDTRFLLYTNSCPMGDARYFGVSETEQSTPAPKAEDEPMEVDGAGKKSRVRTVKQENLGKIQVFKTKPSQGIFTEVPICFDDEIKEKHCIKSPSDKLLLRNMTGFQGALISTLISPVYISDYYVQRAYNEEALKRGLYFRASGASKMAGPVPAIYQSTWKAQKVMDLASMNSFLWCEGEQVDILKSNIGKSIPQLRPVKGDAPIANEVMNAAILKEVEDAKPSPYCSANFYKNFVNVCKTQRKSVQATCVKTKYSAEKYNVIKRSVYNKLETDGKGKWPVKTVKPTF